MKTPAFFVHKHRAIALTPQKAVAIYAAKVVYFILLVFLTLVIVYPLLFVLATSVKSYGEFVKDPFAISFNHVDNYVTAWTEGNFSQYFMNSVIVTGVVIVTQIILTAIISFAIGRLRFTGSGIVMGILLITIFISGEITTIPLFQFVRAAGLYNTRYAMMFTGMFAPPGMGALLGSNHLRAIPKELSEAVVIDGAGIGTVFLRIDLPLMRPILVLTAVLTFNNVWSDYMWPMISMPTNSEHWTLPLGLVKFSTANNSLYGVLCAGLTIITVPVVLFYSFFSKYFIEGVSAGAVKG